MVQALYLTNIQLESVPGGLNKLIERWDIAKLSVLVKDIVAHKESPAICNIQPQPKSDKLERFAAANGINLNPPWWFEVGGWRVREKCPLSSENGGIYSDPFGFSGGHLSDASFAQS